MACPSCARPVPEGARFCPSCGTAIAAPGSSEERRVVTVLFADLVGFTALAEHRDPEHVKRLVEACFERLVADVVAFGGRVDKVLGDAIIALFGAPVAHEDDAERAVRAALRMQAAVEGFVRSAAPETPIQLRIGINTGEVLVGSLAGSDYTAMGDVVNTASRIQTAAPPGGVLVAAATKALCSAAVELEPAEELRPRGREQAVEVWLATRVASPAGSRRVRAETPFVGRTVGLKLLRSVAELISVRRGAVVDVVGEAGIGKTRLIDEVTASFGDDIVVLRGTCAPYGEANVWWPIASALADRFGLSTSSTAEEVRREGRLRGARVFDDGALDAFVEAFAFLLGHPSELDRLDSVGARDALYESITELVRNRSLLEPVVLWIDDLQWADPALLELLELIARSMADWAFLLATAHRPDPELQWPPMLDRTIVVTFPLRPLTRDEADELVGLVMCCTPDPALSQRLFDRSGGNPLFLTELAMLSAEAGATQELPGSLRALIAARLDELPPSQRAVVDNAAVLGVAGQVKGLEKFAEALGQGFDPAVLDDLAAAGIMRVEDDQWRFRSDVVREVAYQTLTKQARAQRHAGVARSMAGGTRAPLEDLAHHTATAAELEAELGHVRGVPRGLRVQAIDLLQRAAQQACEIGSFAQCIRLASRAMALATPESGAYRDLLLLRADASAELRSFPAARVDALALLELAAADTDRTREAEARRVLGTVAHLEGDLTVARAELGRSVELLRELEDEPRLATALRARGFAEVFGGSLTDAEWFLGEADSLSEKLGDHRGQAWVQQHRAWVAFLSGDHDEAEQRLTSAAATFESLGDRSGVSWASGLLAFVRYFQRDFDDAEQLAQAVREDSERRGEEWPAAMMLVLLSNLRLWTGRFVEAEQHAERARGLFKKLDDPFGMQQALAPLNRARVALGKVAEVERGVEEAIALSSHFSEMAFPVQAAAGVAMHLGDAGRTLSLSEMALRRHRATGADITEVLAIRAVGLCQAGRPDEALAAIEEVASRHPFWLMASALAKVMAGDPAGALADADAVESAVGASYLDRLVAAVAGAGAAAAIGDEDAVDERLDLARAIGAKANDVVARALAAQAIERIGGRPVDGAATAPLSEGWRTVVAALPVLARRTTTA